MNIRYFTHCIVCLAALIALATASAQAFQDPTEASAKEVELLELLRSDAPKAEKAIACKNLAIYGSDEAITELAQLLPDPQLSSWARIALEAIPGDASDEALRQATKSLQDSQQYRLLVGTINSIGVRQDEQAVDLLTEKLNQASFPGSQDSAVTSADIRSAAAVALGHIGNTAATQSLKAALSTAPVNVRSAVAEGCVLCAEKLHAAGDSVAATEIYDAIRKTDLPMQRIIEATRGAILARQQDGIPLLMETFQSPNEKLFQLGLGTAREFPGSQVDQALAVTMTRATPERAALIVQAMADRPNTVDLADVLNAAEQGPKQVRISAIDALRRVGNVSCLSPLLAIAIAIADDAELALAAQETLAELPGQQVDDQISGMLPSAKSPVYPLLVKLVGKRRIKSSVPDLLLALESSEKEIRAVAFIALGETISLQRLSVLISQVIAPDHSEDLPVARLALKTASVRMPDREACATELTTALNRSPVAVQTTLLEILGDVSGPTALKTIGRAAKSNEPQLQDTGSRLLGKWNNVEAAPVLLDLAKTAPANKYKVRALRGYLGLARKFSMPAEQRVEMCRNAFEATSRTAEHKLALDVLKIRSSVPGLKLAIEAMSIPGLKDDATDAVRVIAEKLERKGKDVSQLLSSAGLE